MGQETGSAAIDGVKRRVTDYKRREWMAVVAEGLERSMHV